MKSKILRTAIAGTLLLGAAPVAMATVMGPHVTGFYTDGAGTSRRGLGVEYLKTGLETGVVFVAYYTYDANGEPVWYQGAAAVTPTDFEFTVPLSNVSGGTFGGSDVGSPADNDPIGDATLTFNQCGDITWAFDGTEGTFTDDLTDTGTVVGFNTPEACTVYTSTFDGCPSFATAAPDSLPGGARGCVISAGEITESVTLTNDTFWFANGRVYVGSQDTADGSDNEGVTLTVEPGTRMIWGADGNPDAALFVQMGAQLVAEGTSRAPIVMAGPDIADNVADGGQTWGGLIVHGRAPVNVCSGTGCAENEVDSSLYGGDDANDDSGVIKYVRIQNAGGDIDQDPERQYNGAAFHGVGRSTVVEYVQVHDNRDDAFEWFGGTVNGRYLVATNMGDDGLDWVQGWQGRVQHALVVRNPDIGSPASEDPRLIEGDGLSANNEADPRSTPWIANATFIGNGIDDGIVVRRGSGFKLTNSVVDCGGVGNGIELRDAATYDLASGNTGLLTVDNVVVGNCDTNLSTRDDNGQITTQEWFDAGRNNTEDDITLNGVFLPDDSVYATGNGIPYLQQDGTTPLFDDFFQSYGYIGAFGGSNTDWTVGWTLQDMRSYLQD